MKLLLQFLKEYQDESIKVISLSPEPTVISFILSHFSKNKDIPGELGKGGHFFQVAFPFPS